MRELWAGLLIPLQRKRNSMTINKMVHTNDFMTQRKHLETLQKNPSVSISLEKQRIFPSDHKIFSLKKQ